MARQRARGKLTAHSRRSVVADPADRARGALALAAVSLLTALVAAVGPADAFRSTYTWPPQNLPAGTPASLWYAPLLLNRHEAESVSVRVPCALPPPLRAAEQPTTVIATARAPDPSGGLVVTRAGRQLSVRVGGRVLGELTLPASAMTGESCAYRIQLADRRWSIEGGPGSTSLTGSLERMPVVTGLFSGLDLRAPNRPTIDVTSEVHDTRATARQTIAWSVAVVFAFSALVLVVRPGRPRHVWRRAREVLGAAHLADAVVALTLVGWWVAAPVVWDDGFVLARERTFADSGGFSTFYSTFGVDLPLDYWVEWLHHWLAESTSVVLLLRLPALVALAVTWVLCRWAFGRVTTTAPGRWDAALWALASGFLVAALAWDMTIRPEPVSALLATGVAACAIRFVERAGVAPLAIAALLVPLALTAHHTGVVALAPVLAVLPALVRWGRSRLTTLAALLVASISWCVVLAFVGSDVGRRLDDARTTSEFGITSSWRDELERYVNLGTFPWATPLRRASVALMALVLLAFVLRHRGGRRLLALPATMLGLALVLLVVTPSKLPWHFGSLTGLLALAVGAETARLREEAAASRGWSLRPFLVVGATLAAAAWSWWPREGWNALDLRSLAWNPGVDAVFPFSTFAILLPGLVLGGAMLVGLRRGPRFGAARTPWRVAAWTAPLLAGPLIFFTFAVLARDLQRTDGWTLTRQNLESIVGREGCGLADDLVVSRWSSASSLPTLAGAASGTPPAWVPAAPIAGLPRFELSSSSPATPWFRLPIDGRLGLFVAGSRTGELTLDSGRLRDGQVDLLRSDAASAINTTVETSPWAFVAGSELPTPDPRAYAVRIAASPSPSPRAPIAVTAPVTYGTERLSRLLGDPEASSLVHPSLLLYFPCARQPRLAEGIAEVPRYFVWFDHPFAPHPFEPTSPFLGVRDLYPVQRLPLSDRARSPSEVVVYEVDRNVPDAEAAPPESRAVGS